MHQTSRRGRTNQEVHAVTARERGARRVFRRIIASQYWRRGIRARDLWLITSLRHQTSGVWSTRGNHNVSRTLIYGMQDFRTRQQHRALSQWVIKAHLEPIWTNTSIPWQTIYLSRPLAAWTYLAQVALRTVSLGSSLRRNKVRSTVEEWESERDQLVHSQSRDRDRNQGRKESIVCPCE